MKKSILLGLVLIVVLASIVSALDPIACNPKVSLLNQDPYPASPGEYVKVVFEVAGVDNPNCGEVSFQFIEEFPFSLDKGIENPVIFRSSTYIQDYSTHVLIPYRVIVDESARKDENPLRVRLDYGNTGASLEKEFNITVDEVTTDFEVAIKDYNPSTNLVTFEILNIGENDVEALTIEIPIQDNIALKGSRRNIVGSLDSNDDTTFTFEATPKQGEIKLIILYNDKVNERRQIEKSVMFNAEDFNNRVSDKGSSKGIWIFVIIVVIVLGIWWWRRRVKKRKLDHLKHHHSH